MHNTFSGNGNGTHAKAEFTQEHWAEMNTQIEQEANDLLAGRKENTLFIQALSDNWSLQHFLDVARHRGKSWGFLSALADKSLEIQGWGMLDFMADAVGRDLAEQILRKALSSLDRVAKIQEAFLSHNEDSPYAEQRFDELRSDLTQWARESRQRYWRRVNRLME